MITTSYLIAGGVALLTLSLAPGTLPAAERIHRDADGLIRVEPLPVEPALNNPWPAEWEAGFRRRTHHAITNLGAGRLGGTTYGESEKDLYPRAMFHFLNGDRAVALKALQQPDSQAKDDHAHTLGIDYYWCFTLKGQIRKLFYFGEFLSPDYRQTMLDAARIWTAEDPLRRPHPRYGKGDPAKGVWGPENKGSWVDVRDTDNLRGMRDTSVYLLAEATGNEATRQLYKQKIISYTRMLYHTGMREWDSSNYHSHGLSTYHNLYDFARDPEVRLLAKATLDWLYATAALKYYRGGFGGPQLRDYGGSTVVFGGNTIHPLELYFGGAPRLDPGPDRDDLYQITSAYRPPQAVVHLALKRFPRPVEILSAKPPYVLWEPGREFAPRYFETLYLGETFQLGTAVSADPEAAWNPSVFNFMAASERRGVDYFGANTSPLWGHSEKLKGDQVGQYRNLALWLRPAEPRQAFYFQVPKTARTLLTNKVWFMGFDQTWLAVCLIKLSPPQPVDATGMKGEALPRYEGENFFRAETQGTTFAGFALEAGEGGTFEEFQKGVLARWRLDLAGLPRGEVSFTGSAGHSLRLAHNSANDLPVITRNRLAHDWARHRDLYRPSEGDRPITLGWQKGTLRVQAGGRSFESTVTAEGKTSFQETGP